MTGSLEDSLDIVNFRLHDTPPDFAPSASVYMGVISPWSILVVMTWQGFGKSYLDSHLEFAAPWMQCTIGKSLKSPFLTHQCELPKPDKYHLQRFENGYSGIIWWSDRFLSARFSLRLCKFSLFPMTTRRR